MTGLRFERVEDSPIDWTKKSDGSRVSDARTDNFIKSKEGVIPIDLIVGYENEI